MQQPVVVVFTGLPGTGKSTLAERVARTIGAPVFAADWLLGALAPHGVLTGVERSTHLAVHDGLLDTLVTRQLMLGQSAIVDAVVGPPLLARWQDTATRFDGRRYVVECVCTDEALHRHRVTTRHRGIPGWHEIDWAHVERMRAEHPPLQLPKLTVDATNPLDHNTTLTLHYLGVDG